MVIEGRALVHTPAALSPSLPELSNCSTPAHLWFLCLEPQLRNSTFLYLDSYLKVLLNLWPLLHHWDFLGLPLSHKHFK